MRFSRHSFSRAALVIVPCTLACSAVLGQQKSDASHGPDDTIPEITLRANAPLVLVPVTVTDRRGKLIDGLTLNDFTLTDNGVPQKIRLDTSDTLVAPISLVVAVQANGISAPVLAKIHRIGGMLKPVIAGERGQVAVIAYDNEVRTIQDFTADSLQVSTAIEQINGGAIKAARMIDAVSAAVNMLASRPSNNRRILLILGESRDRGSKLALQDAIEQAQRANVVIFSGSYSVQKSTWTAKPEDNPSMPLPADPSPGVGPSPDKNREIPAPAGATWDIGATLAELGRLGTKNTAGAFAITTGGGQIPFTTVEDLEKAIQRTGDEIHSQYLLSFVPASVNFDAPGDAPGRAANGTSKPGEKSAKVKPPKGGPTGTRLVIAKSNGYHEIQVAVPTHPEALIRVRPGYWAE